MFYDYVKDDINKYIDNIKGIETKNIVRYSMAGGKCIRSYIVKHLMETLGGFSDWRPVASIEAVHASSLILDDLPCMDNDSVRRGKPSVFVKYGEGTSILASFLIASETLGVLIQCLEDFEIKGKITTSQRLKMCSNVTKRWNTAMKKLTSGQMMDLKQNVSDFEYKENIDNTDMVEKIISLKTASLFSLAFTLGAIFSCKETDIDSFSEMGYNFGMMFQIMDDFYDKDKDESFKNYFLAKGEKETIKKYEDCKKELKKLMISNEVDTKEINHLINIVDEKISK